MRYGPGFKAVAHCHRVILAVEIANRDCLASEEDRGSRFEREKGERNIFSMLTHLRSLNRISDIFERNLRTDHVSEGNSPRLGDEWNRSPFGLMDSFTTSTIRRFPAG
jgi:hypothetical protein